MNSLFRRPGFWVAYCLVAVAALAIAWRLFPLAIPLVNLDIKLSREDAIARAVARAEKLDLGPADARTAARFANDQTLQNYVELDGGGKPAFAALVAGNAYAPYWWEVRLFLPGEVTESIIRYRPDGGLNGFALRLAETWLPKDPARRALDAEEARKIAVAGARTDWEIDLAEYTPLETVQQKRTTGRIDHSFIYERKLTGIGDAKLRLRLAVAGDRLTEVAPFAHVPESFERRFEELRSSNNTLAGVASLAAGLFYGLGGCIIGVLWLLRRHWLQWRQPLVAGAIVGGLIGATVLASAGTAWFGFDTAQSLNSFWARQIGAAILAAVGGTLGYALVFMAAESLSRRAFGSHPQLWRVWTPEAASTRSILGRTAGGYLFVPIELAFIAAFYYATNRWLGWWQPSESLTDPNILGSAFPALAPIAMSLQAGFMEECVFRAIPLSLAAIIGAHYGHRGLVVAIAVVVQALIFAGAHANYPGFPAYSRLVELFVPSVLWALIFLRFGLVPTIILHATFDLALFAIPVFLVDAPGADAQRGIIVAAGLVPLAVLIFRRARVANWGELPLALRNAAWTPPQRVADAPVRATPRATTAISGWVALFQRVLPVLGIAGAAISVFAAPWRVDAPPLPQTRAEAIASADAALAARGVTLPAEWRRSGVPKAPLEESGQQKFVWREAGRDAYRALIGKTLSPPTWEVRYARFEGDVADRAEEWRVTIAGDGSPRAIRHTLPEARAGAKLTRDEATALADAAVRERLQLDPSTLTRIGAEEKQRPARIDWSFMYGEPQVDVGKGGEARVLVNVAGGEIASTARFVHIPEEWQRAERERDGRLTLVKYLLAAVAMILALAAVVAAVLRWTRGDYDRRALFGVALIAFVGAAITTANRWPVVAMGFTTAEPIASQAAIAILTSLLSGLLLALIVGLTSGVGAWAAEHQPAQRLFGRLPPAAAGVAAALFAYGVGTLVQALARQEIPVFPTYLQEAAALPSLAAALDGLRVLTLSGAAIFLLDLFDRLTAGYTRRRALIASLFIVASAGIALVGGDDVIGAFAGGLVDGAIIVVVVYALLRFDYRIVPFYLAVPVTLSALANAAQKATATAWSDAAITILVGFAAAWLVMRYIDRTRVDAVGDRARVDVAG